MRLLVGLHPLCGQLLDGATKMWAPCNNLQTFAISRPPLVVFTLCLSTFAIATLSLSYIMRKGPITDPDIILVSICCSESLFIVLVWDAFMTQSLTGLE